MEPQEVKITFRGWPGHYICAKDCIFRLNTLLEYKKIKIVVSTVGMKTSPWKKGDEFYKGEFEEVGCGRYYEIAAFHAKKVAGKYGNGEKYLFWDANVLRRINFNSEWSWPNLNDEWAANKGHYKVIAEIKDKLLKGEKFNKSI